MDGVIIVNKPQGWTSFDVVAKIRNLSKVKKVGHSGTLDPMATGVLPVFLGRATKSIQYFLDGDKGYTAELTLGVKTETGDATGKILTPALLSICDGEGNETVNKDCDPSPRSGEGCRVERGGMRIEIEKILHKYTGEIEQVPPMYSAVKVDGQRLYKLARQGIEVERKPRKITIHSIKLIKYAYPLVEIEVLCSKGTYIRQLAVDIGDDLGCGAHLSKLERTYAHPFRISQALSMDTIITLAKIGKLDTIVIPVESIMTNDQ
ncbi:MAG: tRNA pseudouridine(55) synthase TruB [Candidatus Margulisiibacteriota bacterium]